MAFENDGDICREAFEVAQCYLSSRARIHSCTKFRPAGAVTDNLQSECKQTAANEKVLTAWTAEKDVRALAKIVPPLKID